MLKAMGLRVWGEASPPTTRTIERSGETKLPALLPALMPGHATARLAEEGSGGAAKHETQLLAMAPDPQLLVTPSRAMALADTQAEVSTLDWSALRQAVSRCQACELCQTRRQTVFGVGHSRAHWMVIGEAPGSQEDAEGEPFVGAAGQLLDSMLRALALSRSADGEASASVYIANTLKCRPPANRNPQPSEMQRCEPFLLRQIALVQPKIILAMGRFAVQALLRSQEPIGRLRGRAHVFQGVPLVVTYHPAYLLRNLPEKAKAWDDLCFAAKLVGRALPKAQQT